MSLGVYGSRMPGYIEWKGYHKQWETLIIQHRACLAIIKPAFTSTKTSGTQCNLFLKVSIMEKEAKTTGRFRGGGDSKGLHPTSSPFPSFHWCVLAEPPLSLDPPLKTATYSNSMTSHLGGFLPKREHQL